MLRYFIVLLSITLMGCQPAMAPSAQTESAVDFQTSPENVANQRLIFRGETLSVVADWDHLGEGHLWTQYALDSIENVGGILLSSEPHDIGSFCPSYRILPPEKRAGFWVALLSAMARFESGFSPAVHFNEYEHCGSDQCRERMRTQDGRPVISRGILQISQESANGYPGCSILPSEETRLHEAELNIHCGVAVMAERIRSDGVISERAGRSWKGAAAYWSVLREPNSRNTLENIKRFTRDAPNCRA